MGTVREDGGRTVDDDLLDDCHGIRTMVWGGWTPEATAAGLLRRNRRNRPEADLPSAWVLLPLRQTHDGLTGLTVGFGPVFWKA